MPPELLQARLAIWRGLSKRQRNAAVNAQHEARRDAMRLAAMLNKASEGHSEALEEIVAHSAAINLLEQLAPVSDDDDTTPFPRK